MSKRDINIKYCVDIGMLCGNMTEPKYLRSPKLINELTVTCS